MRDIHGAVGEGDRTSSSFVALTTKLAARFEREREDVLARLEMLNLIEEPADLKHAIRKISSPDLKTEPHAASTRILIREVQAMQKRRVEERHMAHVDNHKLVLFEQPGEQRP